MRNNHSAGRLAKLKNPFVSYAVLAITGLVILVMALHQGDRKRATIAVAVYFVITPLIVFAVNRVLRSSE